MSAAIERRLQRLEQTMAPAQRVVAAFVRTGTDGRRTVTLEETVIEQCHDESPSAFDERARQILGVLEGDHLILISRDGCPSSDSRMLAVVTPYGKVLVIPEKRLRGT